MTQRVKAILHKGSLSKADKFEIIVQLKTDEITTSITISLKSENEHISTLKKEIERQLKIPYRHQELYFKDSKHQKERLINNKTFIDYNIISGNILKCHVIFSYIVLDAHSNTEICRYQSDTKTFLDNNVLFFKEKIEDKLAKKGHDLICAKDQFLIYNNQIMQNDIALSQYLKEDQLTANIYLQHIMCDECKQHEQTVETLTKQLDDKHDESKQHEQTIEELTKQLEDKEKTITTLETDIIDLYHDKRVAIDTIDHLKHELQKLKEDIKTLKKLNYKEETTNKRIKKMLEQIERYRQREIDEKNENMFTMNRLEDYASYFGDNYPMVASIISYYEGIMLTIGMIFAGMNGQRNEDECTKSEQFVRWLTFALFFMIPFIIGVYRIIHETKNENFKWYQKLYQFAHLYTFRIIILFLLLLSCDLRPFSCYIENEIVFQLSIVVVGIFCLMVHGMISRLKSETVDNQQNEPLDDVEEIKEKEISLQTENPTEGDIPDNMLTHHQVSLSMEIDINDIHENISDPTPHSIPLVRQKNNDQYTRLSTNEAA